MGVHLRDGYKYCFCQKDRQNENTQPKESVSIVGYTILHVWIWMKCMYKIYGFAPLHAIMNQQVEVRDGGERKCQ